MRIYTAMLTRRWRRASRRGISEIIGAILLIALTIVAGVILWGFRINTPPAPPTVSFVIRSGGTNPVWGDPTDCQPWGYNLSIYPMTTAEAQTWVGAPNDPPTDHTWFGQCGDGNDGAVTGNYSALNTSEFIISAHSPASIPLSDIELTFVCNNASNKGGTTILVNGSLSSMTWYPGVSQAPSGYAPYLGKCGNFEAGSTTAANGIYFNRLGLFVPLSEGVTQLENGDAFILYIHNGGYPLDFECVANLGGVEFDDENSSNGCRDCQSGTGYPTDHPCDPIAAPQLDYDDYHGAPPWCFESESACTIYLTYTGYPSTLLATIPVYSLAPPTA